MLMGTCLAYFGSVRGLLPLVNVKREGGGIQRHFVNLEITPPSTRLKNLKILRDPISKSVLRDIIISSTQTALNLGKLSYLHFFMIINAASN